MNINLHIESIVLEGIDLSQRDQPLLHEAIQGELGRLLAVGGFSPATVAQARIVANPIQLAGQNPPHQLGRQIATSVYQGLNR